MALVTATIAERERPGDLVVVSPTILASPFLHQFRGNSPAVAPPYPRLLEYRTSDRVEPAMEACLARMHAVLAAGGRIWLVTSDRYNPRRPHELVVRERLFRIGAATRTFSFDERNWSFPAYLVLVEAR